VLRKRFGRKQSEENMVLRNYAELMKEEVFAARVVVESFSNFVHARMIARPRVRRDETD
jgi:hypothetical protein